jgi:O-antigen/teichoic acid export membrane protein
MPVSTSMSRKRRFIFALGSGYVALVANIFYVAATIPLALHYLTREEFGLWSVVAPIRDCLGLLDLGVSASVARLLVDTKDDINGGVYGSLLKTASLIFAILAIIIACSGFLLSHPISYLMGIPPNLVSTFEALVQWQFVITSVFFLTTPFGYLTLWSHQRSDVINFASVGSFAAGLLFMWIGFKTGLRTFSLVLSNVASAIFVISFMSLATNRLRLLPSRGHWGTISWERFWEVFRFSRDLFIAGLAPQLISTGQMILVSRILGLDATGVWSVCIKSFNMARLVIFRLYDSCGAGFSEMIVRGEIGQFRSRFAGIVALSAVGAGYFGVLGAFGNRGFVHLWTGGKLSWDSWSDIAAGAYLFSFTVTRCYTGLTGIVKQIGNYKYISLVEGVLVIVGGIILAPRFHFCGVLLSSLLANLLCSGVYGAFRVSRYFNTSVVEATFGWLRNAFLYSVVFTLAGFGIFWLGDRFRGPLPFLTTAVLAGLIGIVLALLFGLPDEIRKEVVHFGTEFKQRILQGKQQPISVVNETILATTFETDRPGPGRDADR